MLTRKQLLAGSALVLAGGRGALRPALAATQITGAGATFPQPFFAKAFYEYSQKHPDISVNYQPIGSGGGIQQLTAKTVDFGASDVPMNAEELARAQTGGAVVVQFPTTLGGEAITYNLPTTIKGGLRLTPTVLADIYLGKITRWNDPAIAKLNEGARFPDMPIVPVNRSDGSGTTYHFTDFLAHVSPEWKSKVGVAKSVQWPSPNGVGGKGNEGVAGQVRQTPGAIGYVELAYQIENHMNQAMLQNRAGHWAFCTAGGVKAAAATKSTITPTDFSIVDAAGENSWPISGFSWGMVYETPADKARGKMVHDILEWLVTDGQPIAATLNYVPLPTNVAAFSRSQLAKMRV
ncbi:MAG: phosphate ABC transporter substrate-binding protein PstS [Candidatus Eremiobacteraeota bacterium]|nr:phosphate ABC transporter substrate-binding protein PstS [Candidatus Eremiobacteraeota bacterium]